MIITIIVLLEISQLQIACILVTLLNRSKGQYFTKYPRHHCELKKKSLARRARTSDDWFTFEILFPSH